MNTNPFPVGKFTAYLTNVSCRSASNHVVDAIGLSLLSSLLLLSTFGWLSTCGLAAVLFPKLGSWLTTSRLHGTLVRSTPPNRVHCGVLTEPLYYGLAFHFQLLSTVGLSPPQFLSITGWLTLA